MWGKMKKLNNELMAIAKHLNGVLLVIGVEDQLVLETILNNHKITNCDTLNLIDKKTKYVKEISSKKLKKHYKKKRIDNIICNYKHIASNSRYFIRNSVYINRENIYLYCNDTVDYETVIKKYKRYNTNVKVTTFDNQILLTINTSKSKNHPIKDIFYLIKDIYASFIDLISEFLVN